MLTSEGKFGKGLMMAGSTRLPGWNTCVMFADQQARPKFDISKGFADDFSMATDKNDSKAFVMGTLTTMTHQASVDTLLEFCLILATHLKIQEIDGMSPVDWFRKRKVEKMENIMIKLEDKDPAVAAKLQRAIDEAKKG